MRTVDAATSLTRHYGEPVEVAHRDGEPVQVLWRGRLYAVRAVFGHWVVTDAWWDDPAAGLADDDHVFWRVEAAAGYAGTPAVVDLSCATSTGAWFLHQLFD